MVSGIRHFTDITFFRIALYNNKLNGLIKLQKDPLPKFNHSNVIYKIACNDCDASYVGQTGRRLIARLNEHRANINKSSDNLTVVSMHSLLGHNFKWEDTTIMDQEPSYKKDWYLKCCTFVNKKMV